MKKITRENFQGLRQRYPVLNKEEMRHYVGGNFAPYDGNEWLLTNPQAVDMDIMDSSSATTNNEETKEMKNDLWAPDMDMGLFSTGGYGYDNSYGEYGWDKDGGELGEVVIYGNYYGNKKDHYTEEEYWDMVNNGTWDGGVVDGWGYTYPDINVYSFPGNGDYYTFPEYISGSMDNFDYIFDSILNKLIGIVPVIGQIENQVEEAIGRLNDVIQADLLNKNYNKNDIFYITYEYNMDERKIKCSVYDAKRGNFILSKEANITGYVYE